jgi:ubiquinol-cytochrome c reductase cytochrome b subunit
MPEKYDEHGVRQPGYWHRRLQARLSHFFYNERIPMPTPAEIEAATHHEAEVTADRNTEIDDSRTRALAPHD